MNLIKLWLSFSRKIIFVTPSIFFTFLNFKLRKYVFGIENACDLLSRVSRPCIIPIIKSEGADIGSNCYIGSGVTIHNACLANLIIGNNSHIGKNVFLDLRDKICIGDNVVISMRSNLITHIDLSQSRLCKKYPATQSPIIIQSHSYIGCNSTILMGVNVGHSAFIAASALVTKDVESLTVVAGIPAAIKSIVDINDIHI